MSGRRDVSSGFSLVELAIVLVIISILLGFGIPSYRQYVKDHLLHGAAQSVSGQVQLARMRAMSTGSTQTINFDTSTNPPSVVILGNGMSRKWTLPRGVTFVSGASPSFNATSDGRMSSSVYIALQNGQGVVDTVSVQTSGLVLVR